MPKPRMPSLSPIIRTDGRGMIPLTVLVEQIKQMDRRGTWHLAQGLAVQQAFDLGVIEENKYTVNQLQRHLQLSGALLGSINSRIGTYRFMADYFGDKLDNFGTLEKYEA